MAAQYHVTIKSKKSYGTIDDGAYCIWCYKVVVDSPLQFTGKVGLAFSRNIDIKDPAQFPEVDDLDDTHLDRTATSNLQYLYKEFAKPSSRDDASKDDSSKSAEMTLCFIAPCAENSQTLIGLAQKSNDRMQWTSLSIDDAAATAIKIRGPATTAPLMTNPISTLTSSARSIPKATLVPLKVNIPIQGQAITKLGYLRQLSLQPGEVSAVQNSLAASANASLQNTHLSTTSSLWDLLASFEGQPTPYTLLSANEFIDLPIAILQTFGKALAGLRKEAVDQNVSNLSKPGISSSINPQPQPIALAADTTDLNLSEARNLLHLATVANKALEINTSVSPLGMLNLERLEMAPAGIERGELIATIPLAPGEKTAVVQKEWSVTTKEFTSIITDSLENFSETGVTDNTELAQSTTSQIQHANQFNVTGTVSGGIPLISGSVTSSFGLQDSSSQSATESRKHATAITQKASARTKQEHKVTISTTTVTGTSETTTRELVNLSPTDPMRIDYFSMMRKWRVRLYRYGLRLTYDIVILSCSPKTRQCEVRALSGAGTRSVAGRSRRRSTQTELIAHLSGSAKRMPLTPGLDSPCFTGSWSAPAKEKTLMLS